MLTLATCVRVALRHGHGTPACRVWPLARAAWSLGPCSAASGSESQASGPLPVWHCGAARACGIGGRGRWTPRDRRASGLGPHRAGPPAAGHLI